MTTHTHTVKSIARVTTTDRDAALVREALRTEPAPTTAAELFAAALLVARRAAPLGQDGERRLACACAEAWLYHCLRPMGVVEAEAARREVAA